MHLARAGSAADDAARSAWLELLPRLHPHQDLKLFHVLQDFKAVSAREEAARALVKRWPQYGMNLIYGLLASEAPDGFDRPLKKVRSKAIDEDALRLLDAARMERVSPEASLETYQDRSRPNRKPLTLPESVGASSSLEPNRPHRLGRAKVFVARRYFLQASSLSRGRLRVPDGSRCLALARKRAIVEGRNRTRLR